ncbi:large ribosomal subunit protein eL20z-like [Aristolochia californica]|uniref:large ribosomal subunit protein eL20z-like n=1 Tax=Aristolochia californica TaxID=171875 RepID=UPI0035D98ED9
MAQHDPSKTPVEEPSYGTFTPPIPQQIVVQPSIPFPAPPNFYQNSNPYHSVPVGYHYATVVEGIPVRERRLPCCGIGIGWILFLCGFFFAGIPWCVGAFILLCVGVDYREKPGLIACTIGVALLAVALFFGLTNDDLLDW